MKFLALGLAMLALSAGTASAQTSWTFDRVLEASLASHPAILSKHSEQAAALADKDAAEWARFPTPTLEASSRSLSSRSASSRSDPDASTSVLRVDQPLWTGGRITAGIEAADSRLEAAGASLDETRLDIFLRVTAAYAEASRQKEREQYAKTGVAEHEKLLDMIRRRVAHDVSSQTDQRLAESRLYQASTDLSLSSQALVSAFAQLSELAGTMVSDVSSERRQDPGAPASLIDAVESALAVSPALRRLRHEEAAAVADIDSRRSAYMPQVVLRFEHSAGGGAADNRASVVLQMQPGAGLSAGAGVEAAIARREAIRQAREAAEREVRERVTRDWNEWQAARSRLEASRQFSEISSEVFESYRRQYVIGRKTWIDVLNAVRETTQAGFTLADARAQTFAANLRLQAQTGAWKIQ